MNTKQMTKRVRWCRGLLLGGDAICAIAWLLIGALGARSVIQTGAVLLVAAILTIWVGLLCRYRAAVWMGVSYGGIICLFAALVNLFRWGPDQARIPFMVMGGIYLIGLGIATPLVWRRAPRPYDPRFCKKCGYQLRGLQEPRCPECGTGFNFSEVQKFEETSDRNLELWTATSG